MIGTVKGTASIDQARSNVKLGVILLDQMRFLLDGDVIDSRRGNGRRVESPAKDDDIARMNGVKHGEDGRWRTGLRRACRLRDLIPCEVRSAVRRHRTDLKTVR